MITSDCNENCWILNDDVFVDAEEFQDSLLLNCNSGGALDFVVGENGIAPIVGGAGNVGNALSHLSRGCNGQNVNYVMQSGLSVGTSRRTMTAPELDILCLLGYETTTCDMCYLTVMPEDVRFTTFLSCCETYIAGCEDQPLVLDFEDLLCNDFSDAGLEISDYYLPPSSGLIVNVTGTGFEITPTEQGGHLLSYTVKGCDCRLLNGFVMIHTGPCLDCEEIDPCDNLLCIEDFEEFDSGKGVLAVHSQASGGLWFSEIGDNSLDICEDENDNAFLHIASHTSNREGLCMRLSEPLEPGCTLIGTFDASVNEKNAYSFYVSEHPPCSYNFLDINSNGSPIDCGTYDYAPFHSTDVIITNIPTLLDGLCALEPNFVNYPFSWTNDLDIPINYLILFPGPKNNMHPNNYLDNIIITKVCIDASFTFEMDEECLEVAFTSAEQHATDDHDWNFGDSSSSTDDNPIHTYSTSGTYTVSHTVTDECGNSKVVEHEVVIGSCCEDLVITENTTWTSMPPNNGIFHTLTVEHGNYLVIGTGVELRFCPGGALVIEEGAFVQNSGTLTSLGDMAWKGVFVTGIPTENQRPNCTLYSTSSGCQPQGYYRGLHGSLIENAEIGIRNYGPGSGQHGGMIKADQATFRNNGIGVDFAPYKNFYGNQPIPSFGWFTDCVYENTSDYSIDTDFIAFARLQAVNGMRFAGCTFNSDLVLPEANDFDDFGKGIHASGSGFVVSALHSALLCLPPGTCEDFSIFDGLAHGIYVDQSTTVQPYNIMQAQFENCWRGITSVASSGGSILFNEFTFGHVPKDFSSGPEDQIGIHLAFNHSGFEMQENEFINDPEGETNALGIVVDGIGTAGNIIRRNYFDGMDIAHEAFHQNALNGEIGSSGLVYLCETIENTPMKGFDFLIPNTGAIDNIHYIQAERIDDDPWLLPAGTEFAYTATDFLNANSSPGFIESVFYHWFDAGNQEPLTSTGIIKYELTEPNECGIEYCLSPCIELEDLDDAKEDYHNYIAALENNIDNYWTAIGVPDLVEAEEQNFTAIANKHHAFRTAYNVVSYLWRDTTSFHIDTLIKWYEHLNTFGSDLMIAGEMAYRGDWNDAIDFIEDISTRRDLTHIEVIDADNVVTIYGMLDTTDIPHLTATQRGMLRSIAQSDVGTSSGIARSILSYFGENHPLPYYMGELYDPPLLRRSVDTVATTGINSSVLEVYPIPSSDIITIQASFNQDSETKYHLTISDMLGRVIYSEVLKGSQENRLISVAEWNAGLYIILLSSQQGLISSRKLVVY